VSSPSRILVTGGAGFIGSHLVEYLLERQHEVYIIDDLSTGSVDNIRHLLSDSRLHFYVGSILDQGMLGKIMPQIELVYHLAAAVGVKYVIQNPLKSLETNILGTHNILQLANKLHKPTVFIASSSEVYGKNDTVPLSEEAPRILGSSTLARWGYSSSKGVDELFSLAYYREKKLPVVIGRFFNTCGKRQSGAYGMVLPRFVKQALLGQSITIFGDGKQTRCFSYVGDIVSAIYRLVEVPQARGNVFNIGNNEEITIEELARLVKEITGSASDIVYIPYEKAYEKGFEDMKRRVPDLTKIKQTIDYTITKDCRAIIQEVIDYFTE